MSSSAFKKLTVTGFWILSAVELELIFAFAVLPDGFGFKATLALDFLLRLEGFWRFPVVLCAAEFF